MAGIKPASSPWQRGMLPLALHSLVGKEGVEPPPESYKGSALPLRHMPWWTPGDSNPDFQHAMLVCYRYTGRPSGPPRSHTALSSTSRRRAVDAPANLGDLCEAGTLLANNSHCHSSPTTGHWWSVVELHHDYHLSYTSVVRVVCACHTDGPLWGCEDLNLGPHAFLKRLLFRGTDAAKLHHIPFVLVCSSPPVNGCGQLSWWTGRDSNPHFPRARRMFCRCHYQPWWSAAELNRVLLRVREMCYRHTREPLAVCAGISVRYFPTIEPASPEFCVSLTVRDQSRLTDRPGGDVRI